MDRSTEAQTDRDERVEALVADLMTRFRIPGMSLAVTNAEGLLFVAGFGLSDLARDTPASASTSYLWFSLTKIATATAALRLADEGYLDLHAPVSTYITTYRPDRAARTATVGQLLNHTAGVANPLPLRWVRTADTAAPDPHKFLETILTKHTKPKHPIGTTAHYSNLGYLMLADIISQASGRPFAAYLTDAVLAPLGMDQTGFDHPTGTEPAVGYLRAPAVIQPLLRALLPTGVVGRRTHGHIAFNPFLVNGAGYGGLVGNVIDAAKLAAFHLGNGTTSNGQTILRPDTIQAMQTITTPGRPFDLGLGWFRESGRTAEDGVEHLGGGGGYHNVVRIYPARNLGIVTMANTTRPYDRHRFFTAVAQLDWPSTT